MTSPSADLDIVHMSLASVWTDLCDDLRGNTSNAWLAVLTVNERRWPSRIASNAREFARLRRVKRRIAVEAMLSVDPKPPTDE